jgi:hypothetical protein
MTTGELIDWLRYRAIDFGMPSQFIDCVGDLHSLDGADAEIGALKADLEEALEERDALRDALRGLLANPDDQQKHEIAQGVLDDLRP